MISRSTPEEIKLHTDQFTNNFVTFISTNCLHFEDAFSLILSVFMRAKVAYFETLKTEGKANDLELSKIFEELDHAQIQVLAESFYKSEHLGGVARLLFARECEHSPDTDDIVRRTMREM